MEAAFSEPLDQRIGPDRELRAETHDQQHRRVALVAGRLVFDLDAVRFDPRHVASALQSDATTGPSAPPTTARSAFARRSTVVRAGAPAAGWATLRDRPWCARHVRQPEVQRVPAPRPSTKRP